MLSSSSRRSRRNRDTSSSNTDTPFSQSFFACQEGSTSSTCSCPLCASSSSTASCSTSNFTTCPTSSTCSCSTTATCPSFSCGQIFSSLPSGAIPISCPSSCESPEDPCSRSCSCPPRRRQRGDMEVCGFRALIVPLTHLKSLMTGKEGPISFNFHRKNRTITMQWEPFTGQLAANGVAYVSLCQTIYNLPPYPMQFPIRMTYNGKARMTYLEVDPSSADGSNDQIRFYFSLEGSSNADKVKCGDTIVIPGSAVTWNTL